MGDRFISGHSGEKASEGTFRSSGSECTGGQAGWEEKGLMGKKSTSIKAEILASNIFAGDRIAIAARSVAAGGNISDITAKTEFTAKGASVIQKEGKWFLECPHAGTVALYASYKGMTAFAQAEVKEINVAKTRASYYTGEKVNNARGNIERFSWAREIRNAAAEKAEEWLSHYDTFEKLWSVIPSQDIGRTFGVNPGGCLVCGRAVINTYGNYPYQWSTDRADWKITCPYCSVSFPSNDFAAYYQGGLNEAHEFCAKLAKSRNDELIAGGKPGSLINLYSVNGVPEEMKRRIREALSRAVSGGKRMFDDEEIESTLFAMEHDPQWGADDGMGYGWDWEDKNHYGNPYTFIGYYAHHAIWYENTSIVYRMIQDLAQAYLFTGAQKYADAAIILLDRVADEYPEMDVGAYPHNGYYGFTNSDGHHTKLSRGRLVGSIWDGTDSKNFLYSYDAVYPGIETMSRSARDFLAQKTGNPQKGKTDRIKANFEDGFIREVAKAFVNGDLVGNPGFSQSTLAVAAVVMDHYPETQEWLNLDYVPGDSNWRAEIAPEKRTGNILGILANQVNPDGQGDECSLYYNSFWLESWIEAAEVLNGYHLPADEYGKEHSLNLPKGISYDLYLNPRFRKMLLANGPLLLAGRYTPNIGDGVATAVPSTRIINRDLLLTAYGRLLELDPERVASEDYDQLAQVLYLLNSKSTADLRTDIFTDHPTAAGDQIQRVIDRKGELDLGSQNFAAFGLGILRDGRDETSQRALWMFYGSAGSSHGHADPLNLGYIAYGLDLMPDLGYPNTAGGGGVRATFENSNMAHNTVSFSTATDSSYYAHYRNYGTVSRFDGGAYVQVINASTKGLINSDVEYADLFDRTAALIKIDGENSYIADLFRVKGRDTGREYQYNFHTTEINKANTLLSGLDGGVPAFPDGGYAAETMQNVFRYEEVGDRFSADWNVKDTWNAEGNGVQSDTDIHVKATMLGAEDYSRVMLGEMIPPQNYTKAASLPLLMVTGKGATTFIAIIEAYKGKSNLVSAELLNVTENGRPADDMVVRAIKVTLRYGRTDYIVNSLDTQKTYCVADQFDFRGFFGVYTEVNGNFACSYLLDGNKLAGQSMQGSVDGTVSGMSTTLSAENEIDIAAEGVADPASLIGKYLYIDNSDIRDANRMGSCDPSGYSNKESGCYAYNAVYEIKGASTLEKGIIRLDIGDTSPVRGLENGGGTALLNFSAGASFRIPLSREYGGLPPIQVRKEVEKENPCLKK